MWNSSEYIQPFFESIGAAVRGIKTSWAHFAWIDAVVQKIPAFLPFKYIWIKILSVSCTAQLKKNKKTAAQEQMFCFRSLQSCAGQEKWHLLTLQKVFRQVKLSFQILFQFCCFSCRLLCPAVLESLWQCVLWWGLIHISLLNRDSQRFVAQRLPRVTKRLPWVKDLARLWTNHHWTALPAPSEPQPFWNIILHQAGDQTLH